MKRHPISSHPVVPERRLIFELRSLHKSAPRKAKNVACLQSKDGTEKTKKSSSADSGGGGARAGRRGGRGRAAAGAAGVPAAAAGAGGGSGGRGSRGAVGLGDASRHGGHGGAGRGRRVAGVGGGRGGAGGGRNSGGDVLAQGLAVGGSLGEVARVGALGEQARSSDVGNVLLLLTTLAGDVGAVAAGRGNSAAQTVDSAGGEGREVLSDDGRGGGGEDDGELHFGLFVWFFNGEWLKSECDEVSCIY